MVSIVRQNYNENKKKYQKIEKKLKDILGYDVPINHIGSTSIPKMSGKNIIDILVGAKNKNDFDELILKINSLGFYKSKKNLTNEYCFFASKETETSSGDIHIHLAIITTSRYKDFLILKKYLLNNPNISKEYSNIKRRIIKEYGQEREKYRNIKSKYVNKLLVKAKKQNNKTLPISITLIRHGENIIDNSIPNDLLLLSNEGIKQCEWAKKLLKNDFDIVFSSTSKRAILTAKIIANRKRIITDENLLERGWGNKLHDGKETDEQAKARFEDFINEIIKKYKNKKILIVTHGSLIKIAQNVIEKVNIPRNNIDNCSIIKYTRINELTNTKAYYFCNKYCSSPYDNQMKIYKI